MSRPSASSPREVGVGTGLAMPTVALGKSNLEAGFTPPSPLSKNKRCTTKRPMAILAK